MNKFKYFRWQISLKVLGDCFPEALSATTRNMKLVPLGVIHLLRT